MKQTIYKTQFHDAFNAVRPDNFSYEALDLLFDFFEACDSDNGEETELDVIVICCDFSEDDINYIVENYNIDVSHCEDNDEVKAAAIEYLNNNTFYVGETAKGLVYQNF